MRLGIITALVGVSLLMATAACGDAAQDPGDAGVPALRVVATNSIVADWVRQVGGDRVEVHSLLPLGGDPHTFQPGARDVARVADADLIVTVGLGLESRWLAELVSSAATDESMLMELGPAVDPVRSTAGSNGGLGGQLDPHFWFDPQRVERAVLEISRRLSAEDPAAADQYLDAARAYQRQLDGLHDWLLGQAASLPRDRRLLVTSHDTLGYFGLVYEFEIVGAVIPGTTTEREPSPAELARLVDSIKERNAPAVFVEAALADRLSVTVAQESGAKVIDGLYTGSLGGPGSGAETYIEMMRSNAERIVEALR